MTFKLVLKDEAINDLSDAFEWYERKRVGLGSEFLDEVDKCFNNITLHPEQYPRYGDRRINIMDRFPYKIVFELENGVIVVYAVYHDKRDPSTLSQRD
jgi:toxin ParE1/3/4